MGEEFEFLKLIARRLDSAGFPYMLSGSVALSLYAQPRMTRDLDIVVKLNPADASRFTQLFQEDCYVDGDVVQQAIVSQGMFNIIYNRSIVKADFILRKDEPYRREEFDRRRSFEVDDVCIVVVAPEDLILSKLVWAKDSFSEMQRKDVRNLVTSCKELDFGYMEHWAEELGVSHLLKDAQGK